LTKGKKEQNTQKCHQSYICNTMGIFVQYTGIYVELYHRSDLSHQYE